MKLAPITPGKVLAGTAVALALTTGTAYAASVGSADIVNGSIRSVDIKNGTVKGKDVRTGSIGSVDIRDGGVKSGDILDETVGSADIADGSVASADVADDSLTSADLSAGSVGSSEIGADAVGSIEIQANSIDSDEVTDFQLTNQDVGVLFVEVLASGTVANQCDGCGVTVVDLGVGQYAVDFARPVASCTAVATLGPPDSTSQPPGEVIVADRAGNPEGVFVDTNNSDGAAAAKSFRLVVVC